MEAWVVWIAVGILFIIIEIFTPGFFFFSFGIGAIASGLMAYIFKENLILQFLTFSVVTFVSFLLMKKFAGKMLKNSVQESNIYALSGKTGIVTKIILKDHKGYVRIGGEEWSAIFEQDIEQINEGEKVKIIRVDGNKVVVEKMEAV